MAISDVYVMFGAWFILNSISCGCMYIAKVHIELAMFYCVIALAAAVLGWVSLLCGCGMFIMWLLN